ncbi:hypothetical protein DYB32_010654, partial [Aphanomyces invadans]
MQFAQVPVNSPCAESHLQPVQVATSAQKDRTRDEAQRKLEWACLFCVLFMFVEFLGGYLAGSLAIMSDAAHLLSDVLSFFLSLFALYLSKFPASKTMSHGYKRAEVLGALTSIVVIWMLTLGLVWAAIQRIIALVQAPDSTSVPPVNGKAMFIVACMGLGHSHGGHGHSHGGDGDGECAAENLNVRAAYLHALGDFLQSLGVCVAGALIWYEPSWQLCDPIVTLLFSVVVGATTIGICKTTLHVLMEGTP